MPALSCSSFSEEATQAGGLVRGHSSLMLRRQHGEEGGQGAERSKQVPLQLVIQLTLCTSSTQRGHEPTWIQKSPTGKALGHDAVINLLNPYLGTGYQVYVDNWHTSTALFLQLYDMRFGACGTSRENRKG
ncbi:hypothetical protein SKAU_G00070130 [Synaphobranchus kaupii]|uniref:PiggyBac transposable element-derived protein domain-containing protein n=1 Tax=Synaphobranchus kaupii TaxID=118154 RepID=A0A9Q1G6J9_SYNKA|nr:hypothetical protein SKAU_G00070130 [Synaphobranchus kaupii]